MKAFFPHLRFKSSKLSHSLLTGNFKAAFSGKGIEFQDFRSYSYGDDARYIDWATSSREGNIVLRRYKEEKDMQVCCVMDASESLLYSNSIKKDSQLQVIHMLGQISLSSGESFGGAILGQDTRQIIPPQKNLSVLYQFSNIRVGFTRRDDALDLSFLLSYPVKRSLVCIVSDSLNIEKKSFAMASKKHDIIYIHLSSHFENTLESEGIQYLSDGKKSFSLDSSDITKKNLYREKRKKMLDDFKKELHHFGVESMFLDERSSFLSEFFLLMKRREQQVIS